MIETIVQQFVAVQKQPDSLLRRKVLPRSHIDVLGLGKLLELLCGSHIQAIYDIVVAAFGAAQFDR